MTSQTPSIESQVLALPRQQRTGLVLKLLDSIEQRPPADPATVETAWLQEADRRYQAYLRGEEEAILADQVFSELRAEDH
jgi:putative addiction module component (TIGR02574 family)